MRNRNGNKMGEYKRLITADTRAEGEMSYKNNQHLRSTGQEILWNGRTGDHDKVSGKFIILHLIPVIFRERLKVEDWFITSPHTNIDKALKVPHWRARSAVNN